MARFWETLSNIGKNTRRFIGEHPYMTMGAFMLTAFCINSAAAVSMKAFGVDIDLPQNEACQLLEEGFAAAGHSLAKFCQEYLSYENFCSLMNMASIDGGAQMFDTAGQFLGTTNDPRGAMCQAVQLLETCLPQQAAECARMAAQLMGMAHR